MLKFINITLVFVAAAAAWFLFFWNPQYNSVVASRPANHLKDALPLPSGDWKVTEMELGPTEEAKRSAEKILSANEYLNREYRSADGKSFVVYAAYWEAGKANGRVVLDHTPDKCWVMNGWKNDKSKARSDFVFDFDGVKLMPAFYRRMTFNNLSNEIERFVCFWHIIDGERYDYGESATFYNSFTFGYVKTMLFTIFSGAPEQYFIRIDSATDFSKLKNEKIFQDVVKSLGKLILEEKSKKAQK